MAHIIIGARADRVARAQAQWVKTQLEGLHPGLQAEAAVVPLSDDADAFAWLDASEAALLARHLDAVLHPYNLLPAPLPPDFHLAAVTERREAGDALLVSAALRARCRTLADLPAGARVATDSPLRRAQLRLARSDLHYVSAAAALEQDLAKLDAAALDALVCETAALQLLGETARITARLLVEEFMPAAGQGALVLQARASDPRTSMLLEVLNHWPTRYAIRAERAVVRACGATTHAPAGALATLQPAAEGWQLQLNAVLASADGARFVRGERGGALSEGEGLGAALAHELLQAGGYEVQVATSPDDFDLSALYPQASGLTPPAIFREEAAAPALAYAVAAPSAHLAPTADVGNLAASAPAAPAASTRIFTGDAADYDIITARAKRRPRRLPLHGKHILLAGADLTFAGVLEAQGATVLTATLARRASEPASWEAFDRALLHLSWYQWIAFADPRGVTGFLQRLDALGHRRDELGTRRLCAIGPDTAARLQAEGLQVDLALDEFTPAAVAAALHKLLGARARLSDITWLLVSAHSQCEDLRPLLREFAPYVETVAAWQPAESERNEDADALVWRGTIFDYVVLGGAESVTQVADAVAPANLPTWLAAARAVCLDAAAQQTAEAAGVVNVLRPDGVGVAGLVMALQEDCLRQVER